MSEKEVLWDHFSATIHLDISEPQPHYGLIQLNAVRDASNELISCDVNKKEFLAAVEKICGVTIIDPEVESDKQHISRGDVLLAATKARDYATREMQWNYDSLQVAALQIVESTLSAFIDALGETE